MKGLERMASMTSPTNRSRIRQPSVTGILAKGCAVDMYCWYLKKIYTFDGSVANDNPDYLQQVESIFTLRDVTPQRSARRLETMVWSKKDGDYKSKNNINKEEVIDSGSSEKEILTEKRSSGSEKFSGMVIHQMLGDNKDFLLVLKKAGVEDLVGPDFDANSVLLLQFKNPLDDIFSTGASEEFCRRVVESATLIPMAKAFWGDHRPSEESKSYEIQLSF